MEIGLAQGNFKAHFHMAIIALKPYANESLPVLHSINCTTLRSQVKLQSWTKALGHSPFSPLNYKGNAPLPLPHPNSMLKVQKISVKDAPKINIERGRGGGLV
jgi:hypothetical protein